VFVFVEIAGSAILGGLAGWMLLAAFDPRGQAVDMDLIAIVAGAVVGVGINRFLRG
jgi:hypothetical protein